MSFRIRPLVLLVLVACSMDGRREASGELRIEEPPGASGGGGHDVPASFEVARSRTAQDSSGTLPERPRLTIDSREAATPSPGRRLHAKSGAALAEALRAAKPGDAILLTPGVTYSGNFVLPRKAGGSAAAWITLRTDGGSVPAEGKRVTPAAARGLARLLTPNAAPALATEPGAHHYRVVGVEVSAAPNVAAVYSLVALGSAGSEQSAASSIPHHLVLDRVYVHGTPTLDVRRCVALNGAWTAVVDSWLSECHSNQGDSQAIWGSNGPGPFKIVNDYLEGAGENLMFGGGDAHVRGLVPSDIEIRRNHFYKPLSWKGKWVAKNLLELKVGRRVLIEGNVLDGSWVDGQIGFAVVIKSVNQDGGAPWSTTQHVVFRYNRIVRSAAGIMLAGAPEANHVDEPTRRVLIEQNLVEPLGDEALGGVGRLFVLSEVDDATFRHNTGFGTNAALLFSLGKARRLTFVDNLVNGGAYRWSVASSDGHGFGANAVAYHAPGARVAGNVFVGADAPPKLPGNLYVESLGQVGLVDVAARDYRLRSTSPYRRSASDGADPGVNISALDSATAGVASTR